jgi:hypothetical protein
MNRRRKRRKQAKTVAVGCDRLPLKLDGKEGVDGSSPSEGFEFLPAQMMYPLSLLVVEAFVGVHAASTSVHRGHCQVPSFADWR